MSYPAVVRRTRTAYGRRLQKVNHIKAEASSRRAAAETLCGHIIQTGLMF